MARVPRLTEVPVKLYRTSDLLTVAAPMPGLDATDIVAEVTGDGRLLLAGEVSPTDGAGALADRDTKHVLLEEWTPGPYRREVALPLEVDGTQATMTYGNGVVVVALPLTDHGRPARIRALTGAVGEAAARQAR